MAYWDTQQNAPELCVRSWGQLRGIFGDLTDGVRLRLQFRAEVFGRDVFLWGDFREWVTDDVDGGLFVAVRPILGDDDDVEDLRVPLLAVCDWVVE